MLSTERVGFDAGPPSDRGPVKFVVPSVRRSEVTLAITSYATTEQQFFDELRKTPVARVANGIYAVTGYRELMTLAHDPRVSSDMGHSPLSGKLAADAKAAPSAEADHMKAYGRAKTMITSDPPEHDRMRRQAMRHFGPPHSPDLIPSMEPDIRKLCNELLDKAKGKTRIDIVDDYAYPVPVAVICKILGVPLEDEPTFHAWIHDFMAGLMDMGPGGSH